MSKKRKVILFYILIYFLVNLTAEPGQKIKISEVLSIGGINSSLIYQWSDMAVAQDDFIYVIDFRDCSIKKYDGEGRLIKKAGRKGEGPGEFSFPVNLRYCDGKLYISELYRPGVKVFDTELNYLSTIPLTMSISDFYVFPDGNMLIKTLGMPEAISSLVICDRDARQLKLIPYEVHDGKNKNPFWSSVNFEVDKENNIILAYEFKDLIKKINSHGEVIFEKSLLGRVKLEYMPEKRKESFLPRKIVYVDLAVDNDGNIFVLGGDYTANPRRDIYLLDKSGNLMGIFTIPEPSHKIYIDHNNFLYTRCDEGMGIKKYRMLK